MKRFAALLVVCSCFVHIFAQDSLDVLDVLHLFNKSFENANGRYMGGKFKGQIVKGRRNGMGFVLNKDEFLYAGDFYRGDISGMGMIIMPSGIDECPDGIIYVGNWEKGIKNGYGRCYDEAGNIIYQGTFSNDVPQGPVPNTELGNQRHFGFCCLGDNLYYVGEFNNGIANGMGIVIYSDGGLWQSHFKDGALNGIGLYCAYDGSWQTRNVMGKEYAVVTSSDDYKMNDAIRKENAVFSWSDLSEALGALSQSLSNTNQGNLNRGAMGSISSEGIGPISTDNGDARNSTNRKQSSFRSSNEKQSLSEQQHYNSDKRVWANYDSYLSAHFFGGREATLSNVREWQKAMKDLRAKWKAKGKSFPASSNENRSTANCINKLHSH